VIKLVELCPRFQGELQPRQSGVLLRFLEAVEGRRVSCLGPTTASGKSRV